RPLGAIEQRHNYVPAQPVLSCRTVDIDLLGTRTYRPKSTVDILEEQQRLIRTLRSRSVGIVLPFGIWELPDSTLPHNQPKLFLHISFGWVGVSAVHVLCNCLRQKPRLFPPQELLESSQNNRELTSKLHAYWRSDPQSLATGRFVRGQKRPDDVPPTLDAWLTFGGAAGDKSQGVIDAFASFKSSEEYYNIEGSVGSRVAQQLQKGDKIRIGINGVVQSHDFRIKKWSKDSSAVSTPEHEQDQRQANDGIDGTEEDGMTGDAVNKETQGKSDNLEVAYEHTDPVEEDAEDDLNGDFKELMIGDLDDLLTDPTPEAGKPTPSPVADRTPTMDETPPAPPPVIVPLSWDDQCTKTDVKVIQPTISPREQLRPVMSETFPVKFEKLISDGSRPRLAQGRKDGYKIKQRPLSKTRDRPGTSSSSKVKVVYIDPLSAEEEDKVNTMSVEEIVRSKRDSRSRDGMRSSSHHSYTRENTNNINNNIIAINENMGPPVGSSSQRAGNKNGTSNGGGAQRGTISRPGSHHSLILDHSRVSSPKLKTLPIHPAALQHNQADLSDLTIMNNSRGDGGLEQSTQGRPLRSGTPSRSSALKAGNPRASSSHGGSSIKAMGSNQQISASGEAEYIKITSQLKMGGVAFLPSSAYPVALQHNHHQLAQSYQFSPGSNTPCDLDYQETAPGDYYHDRDDPPNFEIHPHSNHANASIAMPSRRSNELYSDQATEEGLQKAEAADTRASSPLSESPPATTVAISIPTADELSDREESPSHSPVRGARVSPDSTALTPLERRERDLRNEQIDQITDLIGGNIVNEG
ncbi:hypothetical protein EGW08_007109, partial [Elysia chlorotica]